MRAGQCSPIYELLQESRDQAGHLQLIIHNCAVSDVASSNLRGQLAIQIPTLLRWSTVEFVGFVLLAARISFLVLYACIPHVRFLSRAGLSSFHTE